MAVSSSKVSVSFPAHNFHSTKNEREKPVLLRQDRPSHEVNTGPVVGNIISETKPSWCGAAPSDVTALP